MIVYKKGDIFSTSAQALAHGCNTNGRMGAGIAKTFKTKYYVMYKEYKRLCGDCRFNIGEGFIYKTEEGKYIFNLATQGNLSGASVENVYLCLEWMKEQMKKLQISGLAMPKIGCGLGGLDWLNDVYPIVEEVFGGEVLIVEVWEKAGS